MAFQAVYEKKLTMINKALEQSMSATNHSPTTIQKAMKYSLFAGGKRLRPIMLLAANEMAGGNNEDGLALACGLEMIHTYSLIHDDLPAMDDDDYRRGLPTNHKVFGESMAILAGDGLLNLAYETMLSKALSVQNPGAYIHAIHTIASAAGVLGMIGGQVIDIENEGVTSCDEEVLSYIHTHKTGALITAALEAGVILQSQSQSYESSLLQAISNYGENLGLAFQITDDILDVTGELLLVGKTPGSDARKGKSTFPSRYGLEASKQMAQDLVDEACALLEPFGCAGDFLRQLANSVLERKK